MRVYRVGFWIGVWSCIASLILILLVRFFPIIPALKFFIGYIEDINGIFYDICLGVFASAIIIIITSLGSYFITKKKAIGLVKHYCGEYILKLVELINIIVKIDDDIVKIDLKEIAQSISSNKELYELIAEIESIYDEMMLNDTDFRPLLRKNKDNLALHRLRIRWAKINECIQKCSAYYKQCNNVVIALEYKTNVDDLKNQLKVLVQADSEKLYLQFRNLYEELVKKYPSVTGHNVSEDKCL